MIISSNILLQNLPLIWIQDYPLFTYFTNAEPIVLIIKWIVNPKSLERHLLALMFDLSP